MKPYLSILFLILLSLNILAQEADDEWMLVRGTNDPGVVYDSFVETPSGRLLAVGKDGQLMFSDDAGMTWDYEVIRDQFGQGINGLITDMVVFEGQLIGVLLDFVPSTNRFNLPLEGRTRLLSSNNNGISWTVNDFPVRQALLDGVIYPGVLLPRLFITPAGELLAYGSTAIGGQFLMYYRGGAVFRRLSAGSWEQSYFQNGPISSMAEADGRLTATGFQTIIDSPDGRAWSGYQHEDGTFEADGESLSAELKRSFIGSDVAFRNNQYVMQTQALTPVPTRPRLFSTKVDRAFIFSSGNPFVGARLWTGEEQSQIFPNWLEVGGSILSLSPAGAFSSSNGTNWTLVDDTVAMFSRSLGPVGTQSVVAVGNSREAWRSDNGGSSWTKLLDLPDVPSVNILGQLNGVLFGQVCNFGCDELYASFDNGVSWRQLADIDAQTGVGINDLVAVDDRLWAIQGFPGAYSISDDNGETWTELDTPFNGASDLIVADGGRLIRPSGGRSGLTGLGAVYTSDDNGASWQGYDVEDLDAPPMKDGVHTGEGRILILYNTFGSIGPALFVSDDNGETWRRENPFQSLPLRSTSGRGGDAAIELNDIVRLASGRLIILGGGGEILTSDDQGESWTVRIDYDGQRGPGDPFLDWTVYDIATMDERIVVPASRRDREGGPDVYFVFVSEDDGTSWREVPLPTIRAMRFASVGLNGRVVLSGSAGNIVISDFDQNEASGVPEPYVIREGETLALPVARPPADGTVTLRYELLPISADPEVDYVAASGELSWAKDDVNAKSVMISALEDAEAEPDEALQVRFSVQDDVIFEFAYRVTIDDNEAGDQPGIDLIGADRLETSEAGEVASFRVALQTPPSSEVTMTVEETQSNGVRQGKAAEVSVTPATLVFNSGNWNQAQTITLTGLDDDETDRDVAVRLVLETTSDDEDYDSLFGVPVYVVNRDNDQVEAIFRDRFELD